MFFVLAVKGDGLRQSIYKAYAWFPADQTANFTDIRVKITWLLS